MSRIVKTGVIVLEEFEVFDDDDLPVTGVTGFVTYLDKDGVASSQTVTITEIGSGRYKATFGPNATGVWRLRITHATHNKRGWAETYDVKTDGVPQLSDVVTQLLDTEEVDGYSIRDAFKISAAALAGKSSGGPDNSVFRAIDDSADRIASVADEDGNRTSVTLTP